VQARQIETLRVGDEVDVNCQSGWQRGVVTARVVHPRRGGTEIDVDVVEDLRVRTYSVLLEDPEEGKSVAVAGVCPVERCEGLSSRVSVWKCERGG
jgi:hypothetical protein